MITLLYPEVMQAVSKLPLGLIALEIPGDPVPKLLVKVSKETVLTAKVNRGFSIYLIPYQLPGQDPALGFLAAFFDDEDEPLVAGGAFIEEMNAKGMRQLLLEGEADVHLFDELGREMLGYRAAIIMGKQYREALSTTVFPRFEGLPQGRVQTFISEWFSFRTALDDAEAIRVEFKDSLFAEDFFRVDVTEQSRSYHGSSRLRYSELVRTKPGEFQEREIVEMLQRIFPSEGIYWGPLRTNDLEEVADIIVVTDERVLIIQAKDSPNTERVLRNTVARKRATTKSAIDKARRQIRGAVGYMRKASPMPIVIDNHARSIDWSGKELYSLIVVKELFDIDFDKYTPPIVDLAQRIEVPCIVLCFTELHEFTTYLHHEDDFFVAYDRIFDHGINTGMFPRLRLHPPGTKLPQ